MLHLWGKYIRTCRKRNAGHPDRGRQRHGRQEDGPFAGTQPVQHQQGDQAQHVVPVQRERVLTAVPAEASEDGPVDGPVSHRRPLRFPAAGRQREPQRHHPPLPAQTHDHRTRYGKMAPGDRRRDRQQAHASARLPHPPAEAFADELLESAENKDAALTNR